MEKDVLESEIYHPGPVRDYFVERDGLRFAGTHLFLELWGARHLHDKNMIEKALCGAAERAGATVLHSYFHRFGSGGGVSGVVILAESHISIHTWPERMFAAVDVFMCGVCNPYDTIPALREVFRPDHLEIDEKKRGVLP